MFGAWCNTAVFGGMIFLLDILTYMNMFGERDTEGADVTVLSGVMLESWSKQL